MKSKITSVMAILSLLLSCCGQTAADMDVQSEETEVMTETTTEVTSETTAETETPAE